LSAQPWTWLRSDPETVRPHNTPSSLTSRERERERERTRDLAEFNFNYLIK